MRERQITGAIFAAITLPTLLGLTALLLRPVHIFFYSFTLWALFALAGVVIVAVGWAEGRQFPRPVLPIFGLLLFVLYRVTLLPVMVHNIDARFIIDALILLPFTLYMGWIAHRTRWKTWAGWLAALLIMPLITKTAVVLVDGSPLDFLMFKILRESSTAGMMALLILACLPFAYRYGTKAVLVILGFLFFSGVGDTALYSSDLLQRAVAALYVVIFLLVIPALNVYAATPRREGLSILLPLLFLYSITLIIRGVDDGWFTEQFLYAVGEGLQVLVGVAIALHIYSRLPHNAAPTVMTPKVDAAPIQT
jgi:hypothetical protein